MALPADDGGDPPAGGLSAVDRVKAMSLEEVQQLLSKGGRRTEIVRASDGAALLRRVKPRTVIRDRGDGVRLTVTLAQLFAAAAALPAALALLFLLWWRPHLALLGGSAALGALGGVFGAWRYRRNAKAKAQSQELVRGQSCGLLHARARAPHAGAGPRRRGTRAGAPAAGGGSPWGLRCTQAAAGRLPRRTAAPSPALLPAQRGSGGRDMVPQHVQKHETTTGPFLPHPRPPKPNQPAPRQLSMDPGLKGCQYLLGGVPSWISLTDREKMEVGGERGASGGVSELVKSCREAVGAAPPLRQGQRRSNLPQRPSPHPCSSSSSPPFPPPPVPPVT